MPRWMKFMAAPLEEGAFRTSPQDLVPFGGKTCRRSLHVGPLSWSNCARRRFVNRRDHVSRKRDRLAVDLIQRRLAGTESQVLKHLGLSFPSRTLQTGAEDITMMQLCMLAPLVRLLALMVLITAVQATRGVEDLKQAEDLIRKQFP